jgi:hypothetical protein
MERPPPSRAWFGLRDDLRFGLRHDLPILDEVVHALRRGRGLPVVVGRGIGGHVILIGG